MSQRLLIFFGIGVAVVAIVLGIAYMGNRGNKLELKGEILKVRSGAIDEHNSATVLDFRVENVSDVAFVVKSVKIFADPASGDKVEGDTISRTDVKQLLQFNRFLGQQYNEPLTVKETIAPHQKIDRMVAARFEMTPDDFNKVKRFHLYIQDMDGTEFDVAKAPQ